MKWLNTSTTIWRREFRAMRTQAGFLVGLTLTLLGGLALAVLMDGF